MNQVQAPQRRPGLELWLVLGLSLGASAVYSVVSLLKTVTAGPLGEGTTEMNPSRDERPWFDLAYQLLEVGFTLVPVALALYFMSLDDPAGSLKRRLGLLTETPGKALTAGLGLAAAIGIPGLAVYWAGRQLGVTTDIAASSLEGRWWTIAVLILRAAMNGISEEVIVVGFLMDRLQRLGWSLPKIVAVSALLRGSYHLYQGVGQAIGNVAMGVVFALWFHRTGRVAPLVIAHTVINVVAFVGYATVAGPLGLQ